MRISVTWSSKRFWYLLIWCRRDTNRSGFRTTWYETLQIFFIFFNILLLVRSTVGVTTENLTLNKWKTRPTEFFEDCEKCEKKLHEVKTQTLEMNFEVLKFLNPPMEGTDRSKKNFGSIFIYGTLKSEFVCESYGYFTNGLQIRRQNSPKVGKICGSG